MDNESCGRAQEMLHLLLGCFPVHIKLFWNENHIRTLAPLPRIASICNSAPRVVTRNLFQISWRHNQPLPPFIHCSSEPGASAPLFMRTPVFCGNYYGIFCVKNRLFLERVFHIWNQLLVRGLFMSYCYRLIFVLSGSNRNCDTLLVHVTFR